MRVVIPDALLGLAGDPFVEFRASIQEALVSRRFEDVEVVVLDAAVLFEAGWDDLCTHLVFVSAPADERRRRVLFTAASGPDHEKFRALAPAPEDEKQANTCA